MSEPSAARRERVTLQACLPAPDGEFEILAITAGNGNGWEFPAAALRESLPLWDGVECFIDHDWKARSLRDLAGVCYDPRWSEEEGGIRLSLRPFGPSAGLLQQAADGMLNQATPAPRVGFSADLLFTAAGRQVMRIEKVLSVDLVVHPARGGAFLPETISAAEPYEHQLALQEKNMQDEKNTVVTPASADLPAETDRAGAPAGVQAQMCACLLDASLAAAHLPPAAESSLRARFSSRVFEPAERRSPKPARW